MYSLDLIAVGNNRRQKPAVYRGGGTSELFNSQRRARRHRLPPPSHHMFLLAGNLGVTNGFEKGDVGNIRSTLKRYWVWSGLVTGSSFQAARPFEPSVFTEVKMQGL